VSVDWVCGRCGSPRVDTAHIQRSVDERYPLAICWNCRDKGSVSKVKNAIHTPLSPLMPSSEWREKTKLVEAKPDSLW
jgi:hypothetical protein